MKFCDEGIIIGIKKYGENAAIVKVFSREHGIYRGFARSVKSSKARVIFQIGNLISFEFHARLEENLGSFSACDLARSYCAKFMFDKLKLSCTNSLFSIIDSCFLEREAHEILFEKLQNFLEEMSDEKKSQENFLASYVKLELEILKQLGYEIDLSSCVVSGSTSNLAFVSPKSARAVSFEIGKEHENKLLKLPKFLLDENAVGSRSCLTEGLKLSGYFLQKFLFGDDAFIKNQNQLFHRAFLLESLQK
jgi:DNA repair protein RecO (recombination protein O)